MWWLILLHCQHGWIWNHLGDIPLGMSVFPKCLQRCLTEREKYTLSVVWGLKTNEKEKRRKQAEHLIHLSAS